VKHVIEFGRMGAVRIRVSLFIALFTVLIVEAVLLLNPVFGWTPQCVATTPCRPDPCHGTTFGFCWYCNGSGTEYDCVGPKIKDGCTSSGVIPDGCGSMIYAECNSSGKCARNAFVAGVCPQKACAPVPQP
jgi:hypothetical protein